MDVCLNAHKTVQYLQKSSQNPPKSFQQSHKSIEIVELVEFSAYFNAKWMIYSSKSVRLIKNLFPYKYFQTGNIMCKKRIKSAFCKLALFAQKLTFLCYIGNRGRRVIEI